MGKDAKAGGKGKGKQAKGSDEAPSKGKGKAGKAADGLGTCTYVKGCFFNLFLCLITCAVVYSILVTFIDPNLQLLHW